jgi:hypothetical protein
MVTIWGIVALLSVIGHTLLSIDLEGVDASVMNFGNPASYLMQPEGKPKAKNGVPKYAKGGRARASRSERSDR